MTDTIQQKLDNLANLKYKLDVINLQYNDMRNKLIPPKIVEQLEDIEAERKTALEATQAGIATLENEVKLEVLALGTSVKSTMMKATYVKGRETWDKKYLDGYAILHPEIEPYRRVGEASVRLELIK